MRKILPLSLLLLTTLTLPALGQEVFQPNAILPLVNADRTEHAIRIDGILNEEDWQQAVPVSNFIQIEPKQGMPSRHATFVKVLYNATGMFVGVFCSDSLGKSAIRVPDMMRDFNWRAHDTFAICIDGFNDKRNSMSFVTNPYGAQKDYLSFDDTFFDGDWNGLWKVRTTITDEGWYAEFEIPWKTLRYTASSEEGERQWNINFLRLRRATNEISAWSAYPRSFGFNRMEYAGTLLQLDPPAPGVNIQVNPYALMSVNKKSTSAGENTSTSYKVGGEVKWTINTQTTADVTFNTDFAQADADVQVNNVSRFSVLFPEKRQFFLENASLFSPGLVSGNTGGNLQFLPFFSRRVGLSNQGAALPIDAGIRLINRSAKQSFGIMGVRQGELDTLAGATMMVGRFSRNINKKVRLGSVITTMHSNSQTYSLGGVDGFIRLNTTQSINFLVSGATETSGRQGVGAYGQYFYTSNKFSAWWTESILTEDFNPALGFVSRKDVIGTTPGFTANLRGKRIPFPSKIRSLQPGVSANIFHQASTGKLTEQDIKVTPFYVEMQDGGFYTISANVIKQNLISDFKPLGLVIPVGAYDYVRYTLQAGSDPSKKVSYTASHNFGKYYDGSLRSADLSLSVIPVPHISLKGSVNWNQFNQVGGETGFKEVTLYTMQGRLALNPRIQLVGLYQHSSSGLESYNVRFAWEYSPLSYFYFVVNSRETLVADLTQREQQGIIKISFLKQF